MPTRLSVTDLKRFGYHLEQAVHDVRHEVDGQVRLIHFWDNDSLYFPTFGFEDLRTRKHYPAKAVGGGGSGSPESTQEDLVAQALFAAGYIGSVSMLPPHRVEYFSAVAQRADEKSRVPFAERLERFLDERPNELESYQVVVDALNIDAAEHDRDSLERAVRQIRKIDPWTFVLMENTTHVWPQRFRRLMNKPSLPGGATLLELYDIDFPAAEEILSTRHFANIQQGLERAGRVRRTISTTIDAAALAYLVHLNAQSVSSRRGIYPRFYTTSHRIRSLYQTERWFRDLLSFEVAGDGRHARTGTVWREAYYYKMRAMFPALRANDAIGSHDVGMSVQDLATVSRRINRAIIGGQAEMESLLETLVLPDDRPLREVMSDLESMGMADVWLGRDPLHYAERFREGLFEIKHLSSFELTREVIRDEYSALEARADAQFGLYALQLSLMTAIARHLDLGELGRALNPGTLKNLGVERWGIAHDGAYPFEDLNTAQGAKNLLRWSDPGRLRSTPRELEYLVALLISVDEFALARRLIAAAPVANSTPLQVMDFACQVRDTAYIPDEDLRVIVAQVLELWGSLQVESERLRLALGVGYVLFHAWRKSSAAIRIDIYPKDPDGWATLSRDIVLERLDQFSRDLLVLAMNHVVYVEAMAGLEHEHTVGLVAALRAQAGETGLYRLFDTLGWREFLQVVRAGSDRLTRIDRESRLSDSLRDLQRAVTGSYQDHEVEEHLRVVSEALERLGNRV